MTNLTQTQKTLWRLITAPEGVGAALAADRSGALWRELTRTVKSDARLGSADRVDVYANMYFYRLLDVLAEDYAAVAQVVGDAQFHNLVTDYILAHFPRHHSLRYAGRRLPGFLETHRLGAAHPYLSDLARFEWLLGEAFDAGEIPALSAAALRPISPERWAEMRLRVHPCVRLQRADWPVHEVRHRVREGGDAGEVTARETFLIVWRRDLRVFHREASAFEWRLLRALADGVTFGEACGMAAETAGEDNAPRSVAELLARWIGDAVLAGFD